MSKFFAFLLIIILFGAIGYVYYTNSSDVGVQIEKLQLNYAISSNSPSDSIMSFSKELSKIETKTVSEKYRVDFEKNYWSGSALNKEVTTYLNTKESLFSVECEKDKEFTQLKQKIADSKTFNESAKTLFDRAKAEYTENEKEDWNIKLEAMTAAIAYNEDLLFLICPAK